MWASGHNGDLRRAAHGYAPTCEAAMAAFAKSWRRGGAISPSRDYAAESAAERDSGGGLGKPPPLYFTSRGSTRN
jgi:hypothetical protein